MPSVGPRERETQNRVIELRDAVLGLEQLADTTALAGLMAAVNA